ncbi:hypothetical protein ISTM_127 [Insectomime virus]|nr:hypothetical protein ISTM_127 [Insectomime virus]
MEKLGDWPCEWKEILLCTKHWQYNGECDISYESSPLMNFLKLAPEWMGCGINLDVHHFGEMDIPKPESIYRTPNDEIVCRLIEEGRWFVFKDGNIDGCSTCDGTTNSSCCVTEYVSLHDLVWHGMVDIDRYLYYDIPQHFETFQQFKKSITKTQLKKKLFR